MDSTVQAVLIVALPTFAVLIGILVNNARLTDVNRRIDELRADMNTRFTSLEKLFDEKHLRMEQVMDARLTRIEEEMRRR
jgi:hypothetical protein